jgi:hypothetical protein
MKYNLSSSMSDRINYDEMVRNGMTEIVHGISDTDLLTIDADEYASSVWLNDIISDQIISAEDAAGEEEDYPTVVDDLAEAKARYIDVVSEIVREAQKAVRMIVRTVTLTDIEPSQHNCAPSGMAFHAGTQATIIHTSGGFGYVLQGISADGNAFEADDMLGFTSADEAEEAARAAYETDLQEREQDAIDDAIRFEEEHLTEDERRDKEADALLNH